MINQQQNTSVAVRKSHTSKAGYVFYESDTHWRLDKNHMVAVGVVRELLEENIRDGFINTLVFYAGNLSASYADNITKSLLRMLRAVGESVITESILINYKAKLTSEAEWNIGLIRPFLLALKKF